MKQDRGKPGEPGLEQYTNDINWTAGVDRPAGIFWLNGRCAMAAHGSDAEARLLDLGAVPVATLRFDPDPLERTHAGSTVERMSALRAWHDYAATDVN